MHVYYSAWSPAAIVQSDCLEIRLWWFSSLLSVRKAKGSTRCGRHSARRSGVGCGMNLTWYDCIVVHQCRARRDSQPMERKVILTSFAPSLL